MSSVLDTYLGIHTQALALEAQRTQVLGANLANVDTPNYKARDLDFKAALAAASGTTDGTTVALSTTNAADLNGAGALAGSAGTGALVPAGDVSGAMNAGGASASGGAAADEAFLKYRVPLAPSLDGNTVDEQLEESAFAQNGVRYQASLTFLNTKLRDLLTAISSS